MATTYIDPDATGSNNGTSWTDAYTSTNLWEQNEEADLVTATDAMLAEIRASSGTAETVGVTIDNWTTSATYDITMRVSDANRSSTHGVGIDTGVHRYEFTTSSFTCQEEFVTFEGMQIVQTDTGNFRRAILGSTGVATGAVLTVTDCIIRGQPSGSADSWQGIEGIYIASGARTINVSNTVIYDYTNGTNTMYGLESNNSWTIRCHNVTIHNCYTGGFFRSGGTFETVNCIANSCNDGWNGTFSNSDYNTSDIASDAPGANSNNGTGVTFTDEANDDFTLAAGDAQALNQGTDLGSDADLPVTDDMQGTSRAQGASFDMGAFERTAAAGGATEQQAKFLDTNHGFLGFTPAGIGGVFQGKEQAA